MTQNELQETQKWVNYLTVLFEPYGKYDLRLKREIVKTGTDIAQSVFELIRKDKASSFLEVFNTHKTSFERSTGVAIDDDVDFYFGFCKVVGENIASGTPEEIDKLLEGTLRLVK